MSGGADMPDSPRDAAARIAARLVAAGHVAYFAGGCVRDRLLGLDPKDHDVATDATPERVREIFPRSRAVGEAFGVILVRSGEHTIEVATFRSDGPYSDARRPDQVHWSDAEGDAKRRDFTINGLFEDPAGGRIIDLVGGREDLAAGVVRAIGDPHERLHEDRLRALRAVRFAARFGFRIEAATAEAIRRSAAGLAAVSRERIGQELRTMLAHPARARAADLLHDLHLEGPVFGGFAAVPGPAGRGLRGLPDRRIDPVLAMAAWIADAAGGEPVDSRAEAERIAEGWREALVLSNREFEALTDLLAIRSELRGPRPVAGMAERKFRLERAAFPGVLAIERGLDPAAASRLAAEARRLAASGLRPVPLLTGDDLRAAGFTPGPGYRTALEAVARGQRDGSIRSRRAALEVARPHLGAAGDPIPVRRG
jgi:poly(A) polymerase